MRVAELQLISCLLLIQHAVQAGQVTEIYPGKEVRREIIDQSADTRSVVKFIGIQSGLTSFRFTHVEDRILTEVPIFEKVKIRRERGKRERSRRPDDCPR